jgi:gamma-glutamyltranspeptidase
VTVRLEGHVPGSWVAELASRGHRVERVQPFAFGFGQANVVAVVDDHLTGASDPRAVDGGAAGW